MPQAAAAIANFFFSVAGFFGASAGAAATFAVVATNALAYATNTFLINTALNSLQKRGKTGESRGMEVTVTDATADGRIIYGEVRVSGINVIPPITSGTSGRYLHQILALAIHEVHSIGSVYFWQEEIADGYITAVSGNSDDGKVTVGNYANAAWIRRYVGSASQTVDYILNAAWPLTFTSEFRGRGIPYIALQCDWGDGKKYPGTPPVTAMVKGKKCYDPRLDSSPGANPTNASYIAWTENPALCWADFKMANYGRGVSASDIDWPSVVTAANVCDATVDVPTASTQKRYTCNGVLLATNDPNDNERKLLDCMMGHMAFIGGKWKIYAGSFQTPTWTIDKDDWISIGAIQTSAPRDGGRWNGVRVYHVSPDRNWQRVECFPRYNDVYKSADAGERIWLEMEQPLCTNEYEAQRKGEFLLRASRNGIKIAGRLGPKFLGMAPWDTVTINFDELGWSSKIFRLVSTAPSGDGGMDVSFVEEQSADWTDLSESEYGTPSSSPMPSSNPTTPTEAQNFTVTPDLGVLKFDWDPPVVVPVGTRYQIIRSPGSASAVQSGQVVYDGLVSDATIITDPRIMAWYHVKAYVNSYFGPYVPNTFGTGAVPYLGAQDMRGNRLLPDGELTALVNSYWGFTYDPTYGSIARVPDAGLGGRNAMRWEHISDNVFAVKTATALNPSGLNRFDASREAFYCQPGQNFNVYLTMRTNSVGSEPSGFQMLVYGLAVRAVNSTTLVATLVNTFVVPPNVAGQFSTYVGAFSIPSTYYDLNALGFQLQGYYNPSSGQALRPGAQVDILAAQITVY